MPQAPLEPLQFASTSPMDKRIQISHAKVPTSQNLTEIVLILLLLLLF